MPDHKKGFRVFNIRKSNQAEEEAKAEAVRPLTFIEARRLKDNAKHIYETLIQELYEQGCVKSARHFSCLVIRENELFYHGSIRDRVSDDFDLLMAIYENSINAEKAAFFQNCAGISTSYRLLYQIILLLETNSNKYEWLLERIYKIIVRIVEKKDTVSVGVGASEMEARIFLKYGIYLGEFGDDLKIAIHYLKKAMELSKGQTWFEDSSMYTKGSVDISSGRPLRTLSEVASFYLAKKSLKYAKQISLFMPQSAADLASNATKIIAQVGIVANKAIFIASCIAHATYLMECKLYKTALKILHRFEHFLPDSNLEDNEQLLMMKCELLIVRGGCHSNLNQLTEAREEHEEAVKIAQANSFKYHEAESQLSIGKFYAKINRPTLAKDAFKQAKKLFIEVHDEKSAKKTLYLLAKLQADELFPYFLDLLKDDTKCGFYRLRQWKNMCKPFWSNMLLEARREEKDELYCVLKAPIKESRLTFQAGRLSTNVTSVLKHSKFIVLDDRFL